VRIKLIILILRTLIHFNAVLKDMDSVLNCLHRKESERISKALYKEIEYQEKKAE